MEDVGDLPVGQTVLGSAQTGKQGNYMGTANRIVPNLLCNGYRLKATLTRHGSLLGSHRRKRDENILPSPKGMETQAPHCQTHM